MKRYLSFLGIIILSGCLQSNGLQYQAIADTNVYRLAKVRKGMSQRQVLQIMHKPYSYETFEFDDEMYDVWFYVTRPTGLDQTRMVAQNLSPLTFRNGVLVGTGYSYYYYVMKEQANEMAAQMPKAEKPPTQKQEDEEFEKTLKSFEQPSPSQKQPEIQQQQQIPSAQQKTPAKSNPVEKPPSGPEKLPPNVHIISKSKMTYVPEETEETNPCVQTSPPCQKFCDPCPEKKYGPNRFSDLSKGMTESQVYSEFGQPMKHETFEIHQDVYDAWFYDTIPSKTGKPSLIPQHQTILTFRNAVLISMDEEEFYELKMIAEQHSAQVAEPILEPREVKKWPSIHKPYVHQGPPLGVTSQQEFSQIKKGMTEDEVMNALGVTADQDTFKIGDDVYNIWFYELTSKKEKTSVIIPLTFKNGILIGTTIEEYQAVKSQIKDCEDCIDKQDQRMQEDESEQNFNYW